MKKFPKTKKDPATDIIHDKEITDDFRWLEDGESQEVKEWSRAQNEYADEILRGSTLDTFRNELIEHFHIVNFGNPKLFNGMYFWEERQPDQEQWVTYVKEGIDGAPKKLIDPNGMKEGDTVNVDYFYPSPQGTYVAYGISEDGDEMATLRIKDVSTGNDLEDVIPYARYSSLEWLSDESGFFYTRHPDPRAVPKGEEQYHEKTYLHTLGDKWEDGELIFGEDREKEDMPALTLSSDDKYLAIYSATNWTKSEVFLRDNEIGSVTDLTKGADARFDTYFLGNTILLHTNYKAENYRVLSASGDAIPDTLDEWDELIPENEHILEDIAVTADRIIVHHVVDVVSQLSMLDHSGKKIKDIPLPPASSLDGITVNENEKEFFFGLSGFLFPRRTYRYNPIGEACVVYRETDNPINPDMYTVRQDFYTSEDGTRIPIFVFHQKDVEKNESTPTVLMGYGGFGSSISPFFMRTWVPWLEHGGVFAVANIRGGGEYGVRWHKAGILESKQKGFDDFVAAAEWLIAERYTVSEHLGILGGSNGGLLTGAVAVQRPDLFGAVVSQVPLLDMIRFPRFLIASRWVHEYGDPSNLEQFNWIMKWSPYHNVKEGVEYPNILFTTAERDTRVDPMHARKMAALLQSVNKAKEVLLYTETNAGHGPGMPVSKIVEGRAYVLSFCAKFLGLEL